MRWYWIKEWLRDKLAPSVPDNWFYCPRTSHLGLMAIYLHHTPLEKTLTAMGDLQIKRSPWWPFLKYHYFVFDKGLCRYNGDKIDRNYIAIWAVPEFISAHDGHHMTLVEGAAAILESVEESLKPPPSWFPSPTGWGYEVPSMRPFPPYVSVEIDLNGQIMDDVPVPVALTREQANDAFTNWYGPFVLCVDVPRARACRSLYEAMEFFDGEMS